MVHSCHRRINASGGLGDSFPKKGMNIDLRVRGVVWGWCGSAVAFKRDALMGTVLA
jgi:hypothetical protein